jgi:hypothetical protein
MVGEPAALNRAVLPLRKQLGMSGELADKDDDFRHVAEVVKRGAYGIRTRAAAVRGRCPRPLDECAAAKGSV